MPITYTRGDVIAQTTLTPTNNYRAQIEELLEQSRLAQTKLHEFMQLLCNNVKNDSGRPIQYMRAPLKTRQRVAEKCGIVNWDDPTTDRPSDKDPLLVKDIARATMVFTTLPQMLAFRDYIYNRPEFSAIRDKQSPAVKDLWAKGIEDEYKDIKFFLQVMIHYKGTPIPHIVELQLNVNQMMRGKKYGHAFYNLSRLAKVGGRQVFEPANEHCQIVVPGAIKGKLGNKLRTALTHCRSIGRKDPEVILATNIIATMLRTKLKLVSQLHLGADHSNLPPERQEMKRKQKALNQGADQNDFANTTAPMIITCGPYDPSNAQSQDSGPAQAWAIGRLASFLWSEYTHIQNHPGATGADPYDNYKPM